jgi:hypothetical protein
MSDIRAVASYRGTFRQGSIADLLLKITEFDGTPIDPSSIQASITGPVEGPSIDGDNVVDSSEPFKVESGYYVYSWDIASDQAIGNYNITWTYIVDGSAQYEYQTVTIVESAANAEPSPFYTERLIAMREALSYHLACAQNIPVYFEQAKPSRDNTSFEFSFNDWNQSPGVKIYRNENIINEDAEVDYFNGSVTFDTQLLPQETVNADYNFSWFNEEELTRFLVNALQTINTFPPHSGFTLDSLPDRYFPALLYGAAKDALRNLMMCLQFQQPAQVFGGTEQAQKAFSNFETLKQNYEKDWEKLVEQKKFGPYPATLIISTPEYTLPGGRSLHPDTKVLVIVDIATSYSICNKKYRKINSNVNICTKEISNEVQILSLEEVFNLFHEGYEIEILSHSDITGNLVFAPVNYVWDSGYKTIYNLKTKNGYSIKSSDEHLFYINGRYIPLMDIKVGDGIITSDNHDWEYSEVKSVIQEKRKVEMYDLEVFGTANLFANGIKCHNSRWFRMMFK